MAEDEFFFAALEVDPGSHALRRHFAHHLAECGDWRAVGYRWMAENAKWPFWLPATHRWSWTHPSNSQPFHNHLPLKLYQRLEQKVDSEWKKYDRLRDAEADLCRALAREAGIEVPPEPPARPRRRSRRRRRNKR